MGGRRQRRGDRAWHPRAGRDDRHLHRDRGWDDRGGRARAGSQRTVGAVGRSGPVHHRSRTQDRGSRRSHPHRYTDDRPACPRGRGAGAGDLIMPITIHLPNVLAKLADGQRTVEADGATVGAAVGEVSARFPALRPRLVDDAGNPYPFVTYYLNDEDIRFTGGFDALVRDGDEVTVVPAVAGG